MLNIHLAKKRATHLIPKESLMLSLFGFKVTNCLKTKKHVRLHQICIIDLVGASTKSRPIDVKITYKNFKI